MTNIPNSSQHDSKCSLSIGSRGNSYRDSYQPWLKRNTMLDELCNHSKLTGTNPRQKCYREYTPKPHSKNYSDLSGSSLGIPKYLAPKSLQSSIRSNTISLLDRVPNGELSHLALNDKQCNGVSNSHGIRSTDDGFLSTLENQEVNMPSYPGRLVSDTSRSFEIPRSKETSNSSNNSSAPRWSSTSRSTPPFDPVPNTSAISDRKNGGLVGLNNLGNTCFMNSIIQCLSNTQPLLEYCLSGRHVTDSNVSSTMRGALFASYVSLMKDLWNPDGPESSTSPHQLKTQIQKFAPRFVGYSQQDSQEFLRYVLEGLHIEVNRVTKRPHPALPDYASEDRLSDRDKAELYWKRYLSMDNSEIVDLFVGQLMSTLECTECGFNSTTFDPFWDLSLPIPKKTNVNIMDCLRLFTSKEDLDGNERPVCGRCKARRRCTKNFSIQKFPRILVLHLKRFSGERFRSKMSLLVDYPVVDLNLTEFASPSCHQRRTRYNLYAVSNHSGSVYAGHYTATCKHHYRGTWFEYNDSRVRPTSSQSIVSPEGYVLFYELAD